MSYAFGKPPKRSNNAGYASGLERACVENLKRRKADFEYESEACIFHYHKKLRLGVCKSCKSHDVAEVHKYTCDLMITTKTGKKLFVEIKGGGYCWQPETRAKHIALRKEFPDIDFRFIFSNENAKIARTSKTTNAMWCKRHGFKSATKLIPEAWLLE